MASQTQVGVFFVRAWYLRGVLRGSHDDTGSELRLSARASKLEQMLKLWIESSENLEILDRFEICQNL